MKRFSRRWASVGLVLVLVGVGATIAVDAATQWEMGLSAVLEEQDGTKSYWALAHLNEQPDFHDPGCFVARLP